MEYRSYRISAHVHICKIGSIFSQRSMMAEWFVIDIVTIKFHRGEVISTRCLDHLHCFHLNESIFVVLYNMGCITTTMLKLTYYITAYVRTLCPCGVTYYNKLLKFQKFQGRCCATFFGSVQYVRYQIEMQRVWLSTVSWNALKVAKETWGAYLRTPLLTDTPNSF